MEKSAIVKLGDIRNIIDQSHIKTTIELVIENKQLQEYPNIKTWLNNNVKNYLIKTHPLKEIKDMNDFSQAIQELIQRKNIKPPYHEVDINSQFIDELNHVIDYLKSDFSSDKDLSRISYEQSKINADSWLANRLRRLNGEEDPEFVIPVVEFIHQDKKYRWVNLRSHKALKRESFMMNHCIETYWEHEFKEKRPINSMERTNFYSLRDEDNNSIITVHAAPIDDEMKIYEIKEKNNQFLTHENRLLTDVLFKNQNFIENLNLSFNYYESENSKYFSLSSSNKEYEERFFSLNEMVEKNLMSLKNIAIDFEDIKEHYQLNKVIELFKFKSLQLDQSIKETQHAIEANYIEIENCNNKKMKLHTSDLLMKNSKDIKIILESKIDVKTPISVYLENMHNVVIDHQVDQNGAELNYIIKNCSDINIINVSKMDVVKIIEIDSTNTQIEKISKKRFKKISVNDNKIKFDLSDYCYKIANEHTSKAYDTALKHCLPMYFNYLKNHTKDNTELVYLNILKELNVYLETPNEYLTNITFKINGQNMQSLGAYKTLISLIKSPIETMKLLNHNFGVSKMIQDKNKFLKDNLYEIIMFNQISEFKEISLEIKKQYEEIEKLLNKSKYIFEKLLDEDNDEFFTDYVHNIMENSASIYYDSKKLLAEMLKNEMLEMTLLKKENAPLKNISYRFNFEEKKLKSFFAKRLVTHFSYKYKEVCFKEVFSTPYTSNSSIKDKINHLTHKVKP